MDKAWAPHVTVAAIAMKQGQYLMVEENIGGNLVINQPAGHVEQGETMVQAVVRETREETGWGFEPISLIGIYHYPATGGETYIRFAFYGELLEHDSDAVLDSVIERVVWMDRLSLQRNKGQMRSPSVLRCVEDFEMGRRYPLDFIRNVN